MKSKGFIAALAFPIIISLTGCVVAVGNDSDKGEYFGHHKKDSELHNRKIISELVTLMSVPDVQHKLGVADFYEAYEKDNKRIQVLFYRTHILIKDGITAKDECTPLVFVDGELISWGEQAYANLSSSL